MNGNQKYDTVDSADSRYPNRTYTRCLFIPSNKIMFMNRYASLPSRDHTGNIRYTLNLLHDVYFYQVFHKVFFSMESF